MISLQHSKSGKNSFKDTFLASYKPLRYDIFYPEKFFYWKKRKPRKKWKNWGDVSKGREEEHRVGFSLCFWRTEEELQTLHFQSDRKRPSHQGLDWIYVCENSTCRGVLWLHLKDMSLPLRRWFTVRVCVCETGAVKSALTHSKCTLNNLWIRKIRSANWWILQWN